MSPKILLALQFWDGDRSQALELANFLADLEPSHSSQADFLMAARFDSKHDAETNRALARKFNFFSLTSRRRGVGWPNGCNELWFSVMEWSWSMVTYKKIPAYKAIFTFEADSGPVARDWIARLSKAWDEANKIQPIVMAGSLQENGPHINGNALMSGDPDFLTWIARRVGGCHPGGGWDWVLAKEFQRRGWTDIPSMKSYYNSPTFTREQYEKMIEDDLTWVHGIKDLSLIRFGRERFRV